MLANVRDKQSCFKQSFSVSRFIDIENNKETGKIFKRFGSERLY